MKTAFAALVLAALFFGSAVAGVGRSSVPDGASPGIALRNDAPTTTTIPKASPNPSPSETEDVGHEVEGDEALDDHGGDRPEGVGDDSSGSSSGGSGSDDSSGSGSSGSGSDDSGSDDSSGSGSGSDDG